MHNAPPDLHERLETSRAERTGDPLGKVADHVLYEDDDVRVWEMDLEPGEHTDRHHHDHDYLLVIDSGDLVAGIPPEGAPTDCFVGKVPALGTTVRVLKGGPEWEPDVGKQRYREILIELVKT